MMTQLEHSSAAVLRTDRYERASVIGFQTHQRVIAYL